MATSNRDVEIGWRDLFGDVGPVRTDEPTTVHVEREVVPVVFVPGIMGSRLKRMRPGPTPSSQELTIAWEPELLLGVRFRTAARLTWLVRKFVLADAESRKAQLIGTRFDPDYLEVVGRRPDGSLDPDDRVHAATTADDLGAYERGWAGVSMESYGPLLRRLTDAEWSEPVRHCFDLPVHAFGYNWSQSNIDSGEQLADHLGRVVRHYADAGRECRHVILVTHSMGGLVARAACQQLAESRPDLVLGVVHGAQPASGAPNAYWRMKGGFSEYTISQALGKNAAEVTPILGHMPGGLQLLPNKRYRVRLDSGEESPLWVRYTAPTLDPAEEREVLRPETGDPYEEIYRERDQFYRLCDDRLLDPGGHVARDPTLDDDPWDLFVGHIDEAERYHDLLQSYAHPDTVQIYSDGVTTQADVRYEREVDPDWDDEPGWARGTFQRSTEWVRNFPFGSEDSYENTRGFRVRVTWNGLPINDAVAHQPAGDWKPIAPGTYDDPVYLMTLQPADGSGDGTVPQTSGRVLAVGEGRTVRIGDKGNPGPKHEPIYKNDTAQHVATMAIENLCLRRIRDETGQGGGPAPSSGPPASPR